MKDLPLALQLGDYKISLFQFCVLWLFGLLNMAALLWWPWAFGKQRPAASVSEFTYADSQFAFAQGSLLLLPFPPPLILCFKPQLISNFLHSYQLIWSLFLAHYLWLSSPDSILTSDCMGFLAMTTPIALGKRPSFKACMTPIAQAKPHL